MTAKDAIRHSMDMSDFVVGKYLEDLDDAAFLVRPIQGMNHIAWQVGHLISSERKNIELLKPGSCPPLPEGFDDRHGKNAHESADPKDFQTKAEYLALWKAQREATRSVLDSVTEADLASPGPESVRAYAPTVGHVLNMFGGVHPLMHVGQFVAVRRSLQKPVAF